jgi:hypothetical protein
MILVLFQRLGGTSGRRLHQKGGPENNAARDTDVGVHPRDKERVGAKEKSEQIVGQRANIYTLLQRLSSKEPYCQDS